MPIRYDRAPIKATRTPEGFVQDSPVLSRVGVFEYRQPDGSIRKEYRPAEEVFHADHLASINIKPITDEYHGRITGDNARGKTIGSTTSPGRQDGDNLVGDIVIYDGAATDGKRELSLGYELELDETPGEFNGIRYDAVQRKLRVNHLALVKKGRAGNARLNLDAAGDEIFNHEDETMSLVKVRLDSGIEYDAAAEVSVELAAVKAKAATEKTRADAAETARDKLQAQVDGHKQALEDARKQARADVAARVKLEGEANGLGVKFAQDATDKDVKTAVIKHVRGDSIDLTDRSDAYIDAAYDMALEAGKKAAEQAGKNRKDMHNGNRQDGTGDKSGSLSATAARDKYLENLNKPATAKAE